MSKNPLKNVFGASAFGKVALPKQDAWRGEFNAIINAQGKSPHNVLLERAYTLYEKYPTVPDIQNMAAAFLVQAGYKEKALELWQSILKKDLQVLNNIAVVRMELNLIDDTTHAYLQQAQAASSNDKMTLYNLAVYYHRTHQYEQALAIWEKLPHTDMDVLASLATTRIELNLLDEKTENYLLEVLNNQPNHASALEDLGAFYNRTFQFKKARVCFETIMANNLFKESTLIKYLFSYFYEMPLDNGALTQHTIETGRYFQQKNALNLESIRATNPKKTLTIGVISADLREHPVGYFLESLLSSEAATQFSWIAYANIDHHDLMSEHLTAYFDDWYHQTHQWKTAEFAERIRRDGVDILLDLTGYTKSHRMDIFANQVAPVQISWLGYWGTTGLPTMQAVIADPHCVHEGEEKWFTEKVYRMPHTRLCMIPPKANIAVNSLPALNNGFITLGCFQQLSKINDYVLTTWAKVGQQIPQAQWMFQSIELDNEVTFALFHQRLVDFGFKPSQFTLVGKTSREQYLENHTKVDFILDVFPYTGGTTTTEALWMGVPTITLTYPGMLARQGEQLLSVAGLADWVCHTEQEYIDKAIFWANPDNYIKLNELRLSLREKVLASPLFNTEQFAEDWCKVVRQIWVDECEKL